MKLELGIEGLAVPACTSDGRRIAFAAGETKEELWVMENFLPTRKD